MHPFLRQKNWLGLCSGSRLEDHRKFQDSGGHTVRPPSSEAQTKPNRKTRAGVTRPSWILANQGQGSLLPDSALHRPSP